MNQKTKTRFRVAGVTFEGRQDRVRVMQLDEEVLLVPEPTNPYDEHAIEVQKATTGESLGYVPRTINQRFPHRILTGKVVRVTDTNELTAGLTIEVEF